MKNFINILNTAKSKKIIYTAVLLGLVFWFVFRFVMVANESKMVVFNPIRDANENGIVVSSVLGSEKDGIIKVPVVVKNNRAYVSHARKEKLKPGQKIGDGEILSISSRVDLDSGMHVVKTRGVVDGLNYVDVPMRGIFVPAYAVHDGIVMVAQSGVAVARDVAVLDQDTDVACVGGGMQNGDIVILTKVDAGQKVKTKQ